MTALTATVPIQMATIAMPPSAPPPSNLLIPADVASGTSDDAARPRISTQIEDMATPASDSQKIPARDVDGLRYRL